MMCDSNKLAVMCDLNKQWFMGFIEGQVDGMLEVKSPLLFKYKKTEVLNAIGLEFQAYDPINKPRVIYVNICTKYVPNDNMKEQYLDQVGGFYGKEL